MLHGTESEQLGLHPQPKMDLEDVRGILAKYEKSRGRLIAILEEIQTKCGYLPESALRMVCEQTGYSLVDVYGIATFYRSFSLIPKGEHLVCACLGTACHVRGAARVVDELQDQLGIKSGETTPDGQFTLETVNCLGACALGPVVVIDGHYFSKVRKAKVRQLLDDGALAGFERTDLSKDNLLFPIRVSCSHCNHSLMDTTSLLDNLPSIRISIIADHVQGCFRFSSLYGSNGFSTECHIPPNCIVKFFCPYCHEEFIGDSNCPVCEAPFVPFTVQGGGMLKICSRSGCDKHILELT